MKMIRALVVDDDKFDRTAVRRLLDSAFEKIDIVEASGRDHAFETVVDEPDVAVFDYRMPPHNGLDVMCEFLTKWPNMTCVVMTGDTDFEVAKTAIQRGAFDYIEKSKISQEGLKRILSRGLERSQMNRNMQKQKEELETFSDVLVHDLKSPIRNIQFLAGQVVEDIDAGDEESLKRGVTLLTRSAAQMGSLINSLASHIHLNREATFETAQLRELLKNAAEGLGREIVEARAKVEISCPDIALDCCAPQLVQLFQNLFANAIKYRGEADPHIAVSVEASMPDHVTIYVADNGAGVPEEFLERIFEPFKRAPSQTGVSGTGLGLATCSKVAARHGGSITCRSTLGVGSTFIVDLAMKKASVL